MSSALSVYDRVDSGRWFSCSLSTGVTAGDALNRIAITGVEFLLKPLLGRQHEAAFGQGLKEG